MLNLVAAAAVGGLTATLIAQLAAAAIEVKRHDRQVAERDENLEEWMVVHHRELRQEWDRIEKEQEDPDANRTSARNAARTLLLYAYRDELRQARSFVLAIDVEERWAHALWRRLPGLQPLPELSTPERAARLIDYWEEGTDRNALVWNLDHLLTEIPSRATSRAIEEGGRTT